MLARMECARIRPEGKVGSTDFVYSVCSHLFGHVLALFLARDELLAGHHTVRLVVSVHLFSILKID